MTSRHDLVVSRKGVHLCGSRVVVLCGYVAMRVVSTTSGMSSV